MNKSWRKYSGGVVMVEMAIAMVVFSLCLGGMLSLMYHVRSSAQLMSTQEHIAVVNKALQRFHQEEGYVPCPSSPSEYRGEALERCQGAMQQIGLIPYKTLGIPENYAKDGYGFYFTYAVSEQSTFKRGILNETFTALGLSIQDADGGSFNGGKEGFAYLLMTHGKRGSGAFLGRGDRLRRQTYTEFDRLNAQDTLEFIVARRNQDTEQKMFFIQRADLGGVEKQEVSSATVVPEGATSQNPYATWSEEE